MTHDEYLKKRVTIYQVAKESGYSLATVSRVINNKSNVTDETKEKILQVIDKLGYKPSAIAQGLAKSKSTNIGIVIPSSMHTYVASMLSGMVDIARIYGYDTTLFFTSQNKNDTKDVINRVITSNVDGAIIFDDQLSEKDIEQLVSYQIPVAVIGREIDKPNVASIALDYVLSIRTMVKNHFLNSDQPVFFLHLNNGSAMMENLENVAREEAEKLGKGHLFSTIDAEDSYSKTFEQFKEYFKTNKNGFFITPRDSISCGIANAASCHTLNIPEDIQILSVIGTKYSKIVRPSLTSCDIDMYEVGSIGMRMLTKLLNGTLKIKSYPFVSTIVKRESTK